MNKFLKYLSVEIGIEYKACLYFFAMGFYYCMYQICKGSLQASILFLTEMILANYVMCYIQFYLLRNFDESDHFGVFEGLSILGCSIGYAILSYYFGWFDRRLEITLIFIFYLCFMYLCMILINKVKRDQDTKELNQELKIFQMKKGE